MLSSAEQIMALAARMQARLEHGFRVSPETAPLVIAALRHYAAAQAPERASFKIEKWDWRDSHVEEIVGSAALVMIGRAAFAAAVRQYPGVRLTLRQGIRVIEKAGYPD